jgi:hypothetical protein
MPLNIVSPTWYYNSALEEHLKIQKQAEVFISDLKLSILSKLKIILSPEPGDLCMFFS